MYEYSIHLTELDNSNNSQTNNLNSMNNKKDKLKLLIQFKNEFFETFINNNVGSTIEDPEDKINELNKKYILNDLIDYYENTDSYSIFEDIDLYIFRLMFYYYLLKELINIKDNSCEILYLIQFIESLKSFNEIYENNISEITKANMIVKDKIFIIKAYNQKFIDSFKSGETITYISLLEVDKINESNSYKMAINFIREIIENLKEESRLFEAFLYLDSESIINILLENEDGKNPNEFGINMSNINDIKNKLRKLIPKYIIRIKTTMKFNSSFDNNSKLMFLNESSVFSKSKKFSNSTTDMTGLFENNKFRERYIIPILIEMLYQIFGHGKKWFINKKSSSPDVYRNSQNNYKRFSISKKVGNKIYPESGILLENFISENKVIMKWLKTIHKNEEVKKVLNVDLWVDKDFSKLERIIEIFIKSDEAFDPKNTSIYNTITHKNDIHYTYIDSDDDTCGFHKYE